MRKLIFILLLLSKFSFSQDLKFPIAEKITVKDTFYTKYIIEDEYRWMENIFNDKVKNWVELQNKLSENILKKSVNKNHAFTQIDKYSYTEYSRPVKKGKYYFTLAYYNNYATPALFYKQNINLTSELLIDPNFISKAEKIEIMGYDVSKDSKYLAYQFSRNGSDWKEIKIINLDNKFELDDHLFDIKFSSIEWRGDGFFYSKYPRTDKFAATYGEEIYYHKIRTEQSEDELIFKRNNPFIQFNNLVTSDERFLIITETNDKTGKSNIFYIDYASETPTLKPLLMNLTESLNVIESRNGKLIASTNINANNGYVVEIDPKNPYNLNLIIPEYEKAVLLEIKPLRDKIIAIYQTNQRPIITVYNYSGGLLYSLEMPIATSVGGFYGNMDDTELLFYFTSYTLPPVVYNFNTIDYKRTLLQHTGVTFDYENIVYEEVEYYSKDSTKVPMFIIRMKDTQLNGENPTILKAYGGFGSIVQPYYNPGMVYFLSNGGIIAYANIRGGGDFGSDWHYQGIGVKKQNSLNDFISAAEFLINNHYTNSKKLAITGSSNGGLVVGATVIQRPDLFTLAIPIVGVFDMIRFEKFTVGSFHTDEFGSVNDSTEFVNLLSYSPYHNIKTDINYPAMLIITSENDERVPPFHSYKFVAKLQNRDAQKNPILLKVTENAGHYGTSGFLNEVHELAELYGYILNYLTQN